eukprot:COSAG02_NODE_498_length_21087_cov_33.272394_2_plen_98_part_00
MTRVNHGKYGGACMPGLDMQNYATNPYYARSIASIMPGQTWRDTGHKGLMPCVIMSCLAHRARSIRPSTSLAGAGRTHARARARVHRSHELQIQGEL